MTKAQQKAIQRIKDNCINWDHHAIVHNKALDNKNLELFDYICYEYSNYVFMSTVTGWVNAGGAAVCVHRHYQIGKKGGLRCWGRKPKGKKDVCFANWTDSLIWGKEEHIWTEDFARSYYDSELEDGKGTESCIKKGRF